MNEFDDMEFESEEEKLMFLNMFKKFKSLKKIHDTVNEELKKNSPESMFQLWIEKTFNIEKKKYSMVPDDIINVKNLPIFAFQLNLNENNVIAVILN